MATVTRILNITWPLSEKGVRAPFTAKLQNNQFRTKLVLSFHVPTTRRLGQLNCLFVFPNLHGYVIDLVTRQHEVMRDSSCVSLTRIAAFCYLFFSSSTIVTVSIAQLIYCTPVQFLLRSSWFERWLLRYLRFPIIPFFCMSRQAIDKLTYNFTSLLFLSSSSNKWLGATSLAWLCYPPL